MIETIYLDTHHIAGVNVAFLLDELFKKRCMALLIKLPLSDEYIAVQMFYTGAPPWKQASVSDHLGTVAFCGPSQASLSFPGCHPHKSYKLPVLSS